MNTSCFYIIAILLVMLFLRKKITKTIALFSYLEALLDTKSQYFTGEESDGLQPKCEKLQIRG